jgi:phage gp36-like protein
MIAKEDYKSQIRDRNLALMIDGDEAVLTQVHAETCAIVKHYLSKRYQIDKELLKIGNKRNILLLLLMKRIALYILYGRLPEKVVPEHIESDYKSSLGMLKEIQEGAAQIDLERVESAAGQASVFKSKFQWGGNPPKSHS